MPIGAFETLATCPTAGTYKAATYSQGKFYVTGGTVSSAATATCYIFDMASQSWSTGPAMSVARTNHAMATDQQGRVYAIGGTNLNSVERLTPGASSWEKLSGTSPWNMSNHAVAANGNYIYVACSSAAPSGAGRINVTTGAWEVLTNVPVARYSASAIGDSQGYIYVVGGNGSPQNTTPLRYDPTSNSWTQYTVSTAQLAPAMGVDSNDRIYAASNTVGYYFDPARSAWVSMAPNASVDAYTPGQIDPQGDWILTASTNVILYSTTSGVWEKTSAAYATTRIKGLTCLDSGYFYWLDNNGTGVFTRNAVSTPASVFSGFGIPI